MPNPRDDLKTLLSTELANTLGKMWDSAEDKAFLEYTANELTQKLLALKTAKTDQQKDEAQFNLDMLQVALRSYVAQKAMIAGQSAEEMAKKVFALVVGVLVKLIPVPA